MHAHSYLDEDKLTSILMFKDENDVIVGLTTYDTDYDDRVYCYPAFYLVLNHPTFNQIKKKHGINYSDRFYIRLLYAVSFVLSY